MIRFETALFKDLGHITNLEIKAQEYPFTIDEIKPYALEKSKEAYLARAANKYVGTALVSWDEFKRVATIDSIGVHPEFRAVGVGTRLLKHITTQAYAKDMHTLRIWVPSYAVEDHEDPWNIRKWLEKNGLKAAGTKPGCFRYGHDYDWYRFERNIV